MKASELISRLQSLISTHGDLTIFYPDNDDRGDGPLEADGAHFYAANPNLWINGKRQEPWFEIW